MNEELLNECKRLSAIMKAMDSKTTEVVNNDYGHGCKHIQKEEIDGTMFCIECGVVFEDETVFQRDHYITYKNNNKPSESSKMIDEHSDDEHSDDEHNDENNKDEGITTELAKSKLPTSASDLKKMAKKRGIKYYSRMTKKELCEVLETSLVPKPPKIVFTNKDTGEKHGFKSLYQAAIDMKVNPGLIAYYVEKDKEMKIGDSTYLVKRT